MPLTSAGLNWHAFPTGRRRVPALCALLLLRMDAALGKDDYVGNVADPGTLQQIRVAQGEVDRLLGNEEAVEAAKEHWGSLLCVHAQ